MSLLPYGSPPPSRKTVYSPATFVVAPQNSGYKADYYTDGTSDEVQINAALVAANALTNGGLVLLKSGTYTLGASVVPLSNVWLRGEGMSNTKITSAANGAFSLLSDVAQYSIPSNPLTSATISDLELDGTNFNPAVQSKGLDGHGMKYCKFMRIYCHDTTATGLGFDYPYGTTMTENLVVSCGYTNKHTITAASWATNTFTITTADAHAYTTSSKIVITGMTPSGYNGVFNVTSIVDANNFTIGTSNNAGTLQLPVNPGTATAFGLTSDSIIGHNGIGIASGGLPEESIVVSNNVCIGNQNDNFLIEADAANTSTNASYIFANNISMYGGQGGYRNSFTINAQFVNNYDFGSLTGGHINTFENVYTVTAASWTTGTATYTTSSVHGLAIGNYVTIQNMTPTAYNGYYYVTSVPSTTTFTVAITSDPGTATVFGKVTKVLHPSSGTMWADNIFLNNLLYGMQVEPYSDGYTIRHNTFANCTNYGMYIQSGRGGITQNKVHNNGLDGVYFLASANYIPMDNTDISQNHIYNNSTRTANSRDGLRIDSSTQGPITNLTVLGNHFFDNQNTPTQRYGMLLKSGGSNSNIQINDNTFNGNITAPLLLQDTSDAIYVSNNMGVDPVGKSDLGSVSGTVTFDRSLANYFTATLTGNITAVMPASVVEGAMMTWAIQQDSTGSRTLTLPANAATGTTFTLSTAGNSVDILTWVYDLGTTKWRLVSTRLASALPVVSGGTGTTTSTGSGSVVLATSPTITTPNIAQINDANGNKWLKVNSTASAIGGFAITNNVSGSTVTLANDNTGNSNTLFKGAGTGFVAFRPGTDNTNAFQVQQAGGTSFASFDSTNQRLAIGGTTPVTTLDVRGTVTSTGENITGNLSLTTAGNKISIATGSNASAGTGTLTGGTVTISTTAVTANSLIFLTDTASSITNVGTLTVSAKSAGVSFTVTSTLALDTSTFNWLIIN